MASSNTNSESEEGSSQIAERPKLQTNVVTAFVAGVALANFNKNLLLGFVIGALAGVYAEQSLPGQFPSVIRLWSDFKRRWRDFGPKNN